MSGIALATVVVGAYSANEAAGAASDAAASQERMMQQKLGFAESQFEEYKTKYGDIEADMIADVENFTMRDNLDRYMSEGVVDVRTAFAGKERMAAREKARYGLDPNDPRFHDPSLGLEEAKAEVSVKTSARRRAEEEKIQDEDKLFSRRLAVGQFGKQAAPGAGAVSEAMGQSADLYGQQAAGYGKQAAAGYGMVGKGISMAGSVDWGGGGDSGGYELFPGATGSDLGEASWEGSNYVSNADTGELGW